jgi:chaperonin cofactor prefoldin
MAKPLDTQDPAKYGARMEEIAEEIMSLKHQLTDFDKRRQSNKEALTAMKTQKVGDTKPTWVCAGDFFVRMPAGTVRSVIDKEQAKIEEEIEEARKMIKDKATELKTMEGKLNQVGGFQLKGMTLEDLKVSK